MLMAVKESTPELLEFVYSAYAQPSSLFCRDHIIQSSEGVQQGDPLGPLLFCLTIHPMLLKLHSEFKVFYLDDGTLGGNLEDVLCDLQLVEREAEELGLQLNRAKSELVCEDSGTRDSMLRAAPGLQVVDMDHAEILGSPVGSKRSVDEVISEKIRLLGLMGERLRLLQAQDALLLLRHSLAIPKVLHVLRSSPSFASPYLENYDNFLRRKLSDIINVRLESGLAWSQASLPVRAGGIGIRITVQVAPSPYLASAAGCVKLVFSILPPRLQDTSNPWLVSAKVILSQGHNQAPPPPQWRQKECRKRLKYAHLDTSHFFIPLAVETLGVMGPEAGWALLPRARQTHRCRHMRPSLPPAPSAAVLVATQRGNAAAILGTMP